ncbi:PQQ-binding-like beta-propeller repeat protein [Pontibacter populi]|uniref:PQQ-binding-like beta-propeller repeat protein n=1 Tax=Pontibacter populi TaxID=890055 RepID=A0ABV1RR59_9BACT
MKTILLIRKRSSQLRHILLSLLLLTFIYPASVFAQDVKEEWARRYKGEVLDANTTVHLAVDKDGNSYVTGNSSTSGGRYTHIVTAKYSPEGEELWAVRYFSGFTAEVNDIAVDANGDVYIVGSDDHYLLSRGDDMVIKYDGKNGAQLWRTLNLIRGNSRGSKILVDNMGGVFVVGHTSISIIRYSLIKLNTSDGSVVWSNYLTRTGSAENPSNNLLKFFDFELDEAGDVYVTGMFRESALATIQEIVTLKYHGGNGETIWVQNYDGTKFRDVTGLAVDDSGGVFISGSTMGSAEGFLIKYQASDGEQLWNRPIPKNDFLILANNNIAIDNEGGVYSGGAIDGVNYVIRYSAETGATEWQTAFEGTIRKLVTAKAGVVYAAGSSSSAEYLISKYEAVTGKLLWQHLSENDSNYYTDEITDIRISSSGIHIVGLGATADDRLKMFVAKHQPSNGAQLWKNRIQGLQTRDEPTGFKTDQEGNIYVAGRSVTPEVKGVTSNTFVSIIKYSSTGEELWSLNSNTIISSSPTEDNNFVVDNAGGVFLVGTTFDSSTGRIAFLIEKYSAADGSKLWENTYSEEGYSAMDAAIAADNAGGVYITGTKGLNGSQFITTIKYNAATGAQEWIAENEKGIAADIVETNAIVYVAGTTFKMPSGPGQPDQDFLILKYNASDGSLDWKSSYNSGNIDISRKIAVDEENDVYVLGPSGGSYGTVKFDAQTGKQIWVAQDVEPIDEVAIATDDNGGIYLTGSSGGNFVTAKYSASDGKQLWQSEYDVEYRSIGRDITVDNLGGVYAVGAVVQTGAGAESFVTRKYDATDGNAVWTIVKPVGPNDLANVITLDKDRNVIISGSVRNQNPADSDFLTIKYNQKSELPCFDPLQVQLSLPPHAVRVGEQVRTTADFGDYVPGEAHNIRWEWGDQGVPTIAYFSAGDSHITGEHTYIQAGIYRVGLDFSESCLLAENDDYKEWLVIYDPNASSVTGGGQLLSLQTAFPWMNQQLNAQFSFNVKYNQNRNTTPQGQTQLNLRDQGVFRSNTIDWLVVRGNQALWQGTGTLNGQGNYGFVASVWDGRGTGADDAADELRIRIWDKNAGNAIVYDNFETAGDIYDMTNPTSRIVRGQIIIHPLATASKIASKQETLYNYPNTFRDKTTVTFTADKSDTYRLEVYDMRGKLVKQLWQGETEEGQSYSVELDGTAWPKGIYVARLVSSTGSQTIKMLLEK